MPILNKDNKAVEGIPLKLIIGALILAIALPLIWAGFENYDRTQKENDLRNEIEFVITTIKFVYTSGENNSQLIDVNFKSGFTAKVEKVEIGDGYVDIWRFPPGGGPSEKVHHEPATITRRDRLIDDRYTLSVEVEGEQIEYPYAGDTWLIDEMEGEQPYRFIVDVRVPAEDIESVRIDKVRAIVDLEKPAHTMCYLKLTPVIYKYVLQPMQIWVRSTIGLDTIIG